MSFPFFILEVVVCVYSRFTNNPFMAKQLRKAIMHRSILKNVFNKNRTPKTWDSYKKQRNFCVNLLRKTKRKYFENIDVKDINNNKKFWNKIKPFFSNKASNTNKLMLIENNNLISEEPVLANTMNQDFTNITKQLNIKHSPQLKNLEGIINYYHNRISIVKITNNTHDAIDTYLPILTKVFNSSIEQNEFPNELKLADVLPIYKKKTLLIKKIIDL